MTSISNRVDYNINSKDNFYLRSIRTRDIFSKITIKKMDLDTLVMINILDQFKQLVADKGIVIGP